MVNCIIVNGIMVYVGDGARFGIMVYGIMVLYGRMVWERLSEWCMVDGV